MSRFWINQNLELLSSLKNRCCPSRFSRHPPRTVLGWTECLGDMVKSRSNALDQLLVLRHHRLFIWFPEQVFYNLLSCLSEFGSIFQARLKMEVHECWEVVGYSTTEVNFCCRRSQLRIFSQALIKLLQEKTSGRMCWTFIISWEWQFY